jgi:hypothetical protein
MLDTYAIPMTGVRFDFQQSSKADLRDLFLMVACAIMARRPPLT